MKIFRERDDDLVVLATFATPSEAHVLKLLLEGNGIQAAVAGEQSNSTFGTMFASRTGLFEVEVLVKRADAEEAVQIMAVPAAADILIPAWTCGCGEEVDKGFAVCWSCGKSGDENV